MNRPSCNTLMMTEKSNTKRSESFEGNTPFHSLGGNTHENLSPGMPCGQFPEPFLQCAERENF